ncbi:restriction endonuclease subunit S [Enterococcus cecorum]|uniref:restriction endonuclease subunit S n=4 Tax=Enterococcus cecorum TaxID=44008 RepID=UPI001FAC01C9|nr:restriction endonuclease subunit S [Enterococcus cecorum]MCJ0536489.1 restriction endonuclease subunit S [Enterococcus cecorum]MCJ0570293.1 restriction endonuclease subunit S [Enterococcus cecorum]
MNEKKKLQPKVRFREFTGENAPDWEQRKLGEIGKKVTEKNINNQYGKVFTNSAIYGIINQDDFFDKEIVNLKNSTGYYVVRQNDFVYNPRISKYAPVGPIKRNLLGDIGIMSPLYFVFRVVGVDLDYLEKYFDTKYWHKFMRLNGDTGARADRFSIKDELFLQLPIPTTNINEQKNIGKFFKMLDKLITLHQRKLEQLEQLKNTLLSKMFPKSGTNIPEIRFSGFTDAWKQRKAKEIFITISEKGHIDLPVLSASQEFGMVERNNIGIDIKYDLNSIKNYKRVLPKQFVIHLRSFQGGFAWSTIEGITSPAYTVIDFIEKSNQDFGFWKIFLTSTNFIKKLETVTYGIRDGRSISFNDFSSMNFVIPNINEQERIGNLFQKIDNYIAIHQRKLDQLKNLKQTLLNKMFI